ncbi:hypothetical protein RRG08_057400 [Elysia crispata]|uniref:Uncharacterized protein n=1 Tax=Elysia crispata TaxID=231223 RepID=A0AAE1B1M6_9GAST|nr:hypothetical protein RRG08_057400 [Elysia crispata]
MATLTVSPGHPGGDGPQTGQCPLRGYHGGVGHSVLVVVISPWSPGHARLASCYLGIPSGVSTPLPNTIISNRLH